MSPALAGRFSTTAPPGKPQEMFLMSVSGNPFCLNGVNSSLRKGSLPYPLNQLRSFSCYFAVFLRLNCTDFLTSFTFVHLIHSGWFFRMAFIPAVLRRWCSPVQWWADTGSELPGASLTLYFEVCLVFLWDFPSVGPASGPKSWERGGTALWVLCLPTGPKDYRQSFPPLEYTTNGACF